MKEQMFGLKREPIDQMLHKMESDFLYEKIEIELQLKSLVEENNKLRAQLKEIPKKSSIAFEDETLWELGKERIYKMTDYLQQQKESEMTGLRKISTERIHLIQMQIEEINSELKLIEQLFSKMFQQITSLVEQTESIELPEESNGIIEKESQQFTNDNDALTNDQNQEIEVTSKIDGFTLKKEKQLDVSEVITTNDNKQSPVVSKPNETLNDYDSEDSLMAQINAIKAQYIVGKVAGEDLFDQKGQLIISKSNMISRQVVNQAHMEGKLAELIVNMKIPGLGED